jgi:hypothetical protein
VSLLMSGAGLVSVAEIAQSASRGQSWRANQTSVKSTGGECLTLTVTVTICRAVVFGVYFCEQNGDSNFTRQAPARFDANAVSPGLKIAASEDLVRMCSYTYIHHHTLLRPSLQRLACRAL